MSREDCKYYSIQYDKWYNGCFDHPSYSEYCKKLKREIIGFIACKKCQYNKHKNEH